MPEPQTLSSGPTEAQKAACSWAFAGVYEDPQPLVGTIGILKYGGNGGSHFVQSIPGALIFNIDHTPVVHFPLRASMWPLVINNRVIEPNPQAPTDLSRALSVDLTFEKVLDKIDLLVKAAREGKPRPTGIVFDTVDALIELIKKYLCEKAGVDVFSDAPFKAWNALHNQFWDRVYWPLKWAGYAIVLVVQLYDEPIQVTGADGKATTKIVPNSSILSDKFFKRIKDACNVVGKIERHEEEKGSLVNGKWETKPVRGRRMIFADKLLGDLVKARTGLPDVLDISGPDPYQKYATAYLAAANSDIENAKRS